MIPGKLAQKTAGRLFALVRRRTADFVMVGGTRSGSTTLHYLLGQHPEIFMTRRQELQYFNRDARFRENLSGHTEHFALAPPGARTGEVTPMYLHKGYVYDAQGTLRTGREDDAVMRIARLLPEARLVVSLRDPISRMLSEYRKNRNQGKFEATLAELIAAEKAGAESFGPVFSNRYDIHLDHIFAHFPAERVHVMIFEQWTAQLPESLLDLHRFLGVKPSLDVALPDERRANKANKYYREGGRALMRPGDDALSEALLADLRAEFAPTIRYVENLLGRQTPWSTAGR